MAQQQQRYKLQQEQQVPTHLTNKFDEYNLEVQQLEQPKQQSEQSVEENQSLIIASKTNNPLNNYLNDSMEGEMSKIKNIKQNNDVQIKIEEEIKKEILMKYQ